MTVNFETSACQLAFPDQTCPTKILEQVKGHQELFDFIIGKNGSPHTFNVVLQDKATKTLFERQVTVNCNGFSIELDASGKPKVELINGVSMRIFKPNVVEPQFSRQSIQQKSVLKAGNEKLFGKKEVLGSDPSLNIVINREKATADELDLAKPFLDFLEAQPKI